MKTASATRDALLAGDAYLCATIYDFAFASGTVYWTTHTSNISYGGHTYLAASPIITASSIRNTGGVEVATLDIILNPGAITVGGLTMYQLALSGALDTIRISIKNVYMTTWGTVVGDALTLFNGTGINVQPSSTGVEITVKSDAALLDTSAPSRIISARCPYALYDEDCEGSPTLHTLRTAHSVNFTVASGSTTTAIKVVSLLSYTLNNTPDYLTFNTGALTGVVRLLEGFILGTPGTFNLSTPLVVAPTAGDTLTVYKGCRKDIAQCYDTFNNVARFGGVPELQDPTKNWL